MEFELVLGIWLLSAIFVQLAWLASLLCFGLFCCVALYSGLTGAASCGCFGQVRVNPWITLAAIDVPAVVLLLALHPAPAFTHLVRPCLMRLRAALEAWRACQRFAGEGELTRGRHPRLAVPPRPALTSTASTELAFAGILLLLVVGLSTPILALAKPPKTTNRYAVLEPKTWMGKPLPLLPYIDIADTLIEGRWLVVLYHHHCRICARAIPQIEQLQRELAPGHADPVRVALIQVPPYEPNPAERKEGTISGRLSEAKTWFVTTPTVICLTGGEVVFAEDGPPDLQAILRAMEPPGETQTPGHESRARKGADAYARD